MSEKFLQYVEDVRKYAPNAQESVIKKIVGYLGIALQSRDASLVSCTDPNELTRVRDGFCKKKLGLEEDEAKVVIEAICETMKGDRQKPRVTFYYLVAEKSGKLSKLA